MTKKEAETEKKKPKFKWEAFHQPEVLGLRDNESGEVMVLHTASQYAELFGNATLEAHKMNQMHELNKKL